MKLFRDFILENNIKIIKNKNNVVTFSTTTKEGNKFEIGFSLEPAKVTDHYKNVDIRIDVTPDSYEDNAENVINYTTDYNYTDKDVLKLKPFLVEITSIKMNNVILDVPTFIGKEIPHAHIIHQIAIELTKSGEKKVLSHDDNETYTLKQGKDFKYTPESLRSDVYNVGYYSKDNKNIINNIYKANSGKLTKYESKYGRWGKGIEDKFKDELREVINLLASSDIVKKNIVYTLPDTITAMNYIDCDYMYDKEMYDDANRDED